MAPVCMISLRLPACGVRLPVCGVELRSVELQRLIISERNLQHFRTYKQNPTPHGWNMFKQQRNKVTSMLRTATCKSDFIFTLATDEHRNSETSHSARDGEPAAAGPQSHNLPRLHQFLRVFTKSKPSFTPPLLDDSGSLVEKDVGIPTRLLVILKDEIVHCVHHIFTLSLTSGTLPTDWKSATVTPIYKERGNRQVATNYRPISLLSVLSKCLEKLVFKRLYSHLDQFLPIHQSGFRQRDSTAYQLARLVHRLATADVSKVITTAHAGKSDVIFHIFQELSKKKKGSTTKDD